MTTAQDQDARIRKLERQVFDLNSLLTAGRAMHNILDPDKLYEVLVAMVAEKLDAGPLTLFIFEEKTRTCRLVRTHNLPNPPAPGFTFPIEEGLLWQHILQDDPFPVKSPSGEPLFARFFEQHGLQQLQADVWLPLFLKDRFIGLLTIGVRPSGRPYAEHEVEFLNQFAATAASGIHMCLLYVRGITEKDELNRTVRNLSMLYNIGRAMTHTGDLKQLLGFILDQAIKVSSARKGSIMLYNQEKDCLEVRVIEGLENKAEQQKINNGETACRTFKSGEGAAGKVYKTGEPLIVNDVSQESGQFVGASSSYVQSIACIPMKVYDEVIGVINVTNKQNNAAFTSEDLELLAAVADQAAVAINKAQLLELSVTDSLTGLHIRRYLLAKLNEEMGRSRRFEHSLTVAMCDVDHFKQVNDTHGHGVGDEVLKAVAKTLRGSLRAIDHVARYGGEEFILIMIETDTRNAMLGAERLRKQIEQLNEAGLPRVTISIGLATFPSDGTTLVQLIQKADAALYEAKRAGRNRIAASTPPPAVEAELGDVIPG